MKATLTLLATLAILAATSAVGLGQDAAGKKLFLDSKCNGCHAVASQDIEAVRENSKAPDMSDAGTMIPNAEWAKKFVMREEEKDGKKHMRPWKGSEKDLEQIVAWLMTLKKS